MMRSPRRTAATMPKRSPPLPSIDCRMASTLTGALFSSDEPAGLDRSDFDVSIIFYRGRIGLRTGTAPINLLDSSRRMWSIHQPPKCSNRWFHFTRIRLPSNKTVTWHPVPDMLHQAYTDQYHEVRLGANARISALAAWRVFQIAMSRPRLHATSTAKSISGAMNAAQSDIPLLPACQRRRPVSPGWVPFAQLAVLIHHPAP